MIKQICENVKGYVLVFLLGVVIGMIIMFGVLDEKGRLIEKPDEQVATIEVTEEIIEIERPPAYSFTDDEIYLLAQMLCGEGGVDGDGEYDFEWQHTNDCMNYDEINKPLDVVMNRVTAPGIYADNVTDVLMQPGAFSVFPRNFDTEPAEVAILYVKEWCKNYDAGTYIQKTPSDHYWFTGNGQGRNITRNSWR